MVKNECMEITEDTILILQEREDESLKQNGKQWDQRGTERFEAYLRGEIGRNQSLIRYGGERNREIQENLHSLLLGYLSVQ